MNNNYLNQQQFANKLGLSQSYISKLITDNKLSTNGNNKINDLTGFVEFMLLKFESLSPKQQLEIKNLVQQMETLRDVFTMQFKDYTNLKADLGRGDNDHIPENLMASFCAVFNKNRKI